MIRGRRWPVVLTHGFVRLNPLSRLDEPAWQRLRAANRDWTGPWDATRPPTSHEEPFSFGQMVGRFTREAKAGRMLPWSIQVFEGGRWRMAGQMTISGIVLGSAQWGQAGYWVDRAVAGRGVAPTALALAADHMFGTLGLHRLEVAIRPENAASLRVVEKLGMRYEGERPAYLHVDGAWRDHVIFVLHADEVGPEGVLARYLAYAARRAAERSGDSPEHLG